MAVLGGTRQSFPLKKLTLNADPEVIEQAKREPFFADSAAIWTLAETGKVDGLVSAVSFTNIFYVVRKLSDAKTAWRMLVLLRDSFHAVGCDHQIVN